MLAGIGYGRNDFAAVGDPTFGLQIGQPNFMPNLDESNSSVLGSFGVGLKYAKSQNVFLQMDARYLVSDSDTDKSILYLALGGGVYLGAPAVVPVSKAPVAEPEPTPEPIVIPESVAVVATPAVQPQPVVGSYCG